ncbi:MAG: hypothetical protein IAE95_04155 [Chitinophagaceae bacterium]|nr:hypothetical protein [Chitinophagaceae bacterium]
MSIINTDIISAANDVFWQDSSTVTNGLEKRPVLVLLGEADRKPELETQLVRMLDACKLQPADYNIIYLAEGQLVSWNHLRTAVDPYVILLFGLVPAQLGVAVMLRFLLPNRFNDTVWVPLPTVEMFAPQPDLKRRMWTEALKPVFEMEKFGSIKCPGNQ